MEFPRLRAGARVAIPAVATALLASSAALAATITSGVDTSIRESRANDSYGSDARVEWDGRDGGGENHALLYFPIFQDEGGVIDRARAASSSHLRATLELDVVNAGSGGDFYANTIGFTNATTWNSHGGGVVPGLNALASPGLSTPNLATGTQFLDVTSQVVDWANGQSNFGWGITGRGTNGTEFSSFDSGSGPRLTITEQFDYVTDSTTWTYYDQIAAGDPNYPTDGSGAPWVDITFDDSSWATGSGHFGYGDGDEDTTVASNLITYLFRTTFTLTELPEELFLDLVRDDAAVVYLNGVEVLRDNMTGGAFDASTTASSTGSDNARDVFQLAVGGLQLGQNTLAIEVHNRSPGSSDVSFAASLFGTVDSHLTAVPEPGTAVLLGWGLIALARDRPR